MKWNWLKLITNFIIIIRCRVCWIFWYEHAYEMVSASRCILAKNQSSNVIRQQREAVGRALQNYRHSRIYRPLRKRQTPRAFAVDVARERTLPCFYFFSLVPLSLSTPPPSLYVSFSISLRTPLCLNSRLAHKWKSEEIKTLLSRDRLPQIYLVEFQCNFKDSLSSWKVILNLGTKELYCPLLA